MLMASLISALLIAGLHLGDAAGASPTPSTDPPSGSSLGPYATVDWTTLSYPGLSHCFVGSPNAPSGSSIVIEKVETISVTARSEPIALVVASCNLNHVYANLYAFELGPNPGHPAFLQRLALYQGEKQLGRLTTSHNRVTMTVAGLTKSDPLCCPRWISIRRWEWTGSHFRVGTTTRVTSVVMPNVVGRSLGAATEALANLGIVFYDIYGRPDDNVAIVVRQTPRAGTVIHPPKFTVSLTTK
jgi:hypothetical protein